MCADYIEEICREREDARRKTVLITGCDTGLSITSDHLILCVEFMAIYEDSICLSCLR